MRSGSQRNWDSPNNRSESYVYEGLSRIQGSSGNEGLSPERCPLRVVTTIVSAPTADRLIVDGGMKTFRLFPTMPWGLIIEDPGLKFSGMSVEHGHVDSSESSRDYSVGDKLTVIPSYQEGVTNLHDEIAWERDDEVVRIWRNEGRGRSGDDAIRRYADLNHILIGRSRDLYDPVERAALDSVVPSTR